MDLITLPRTSRVLDDDKKMLLDDLPSFKDLQKILYACVDTTTEMVVATIKQLGLEPP